MNTRRKTLGIKVRRARELAGYESQRAFAEAAGTSEKSVADVERGDPRPGKSTFWKIEDVLRWPENGILSYLESGSQEALAALRVEADPDQSDSHTTARERRIARLDELDAELGQHLDRLSEINAEREQLRTELAEEDERRAL